MARILVLEDDEHFRRVLVEALEDEGYSVTGCGSGDEAVEQARHQEFTLIVADVKMQGMDGLGAVSLIQSLQPELRSLVVTGFADTVEMARAENLCLDGFLQKPFDLDQLLDQVESLVEKQASVTAETQAEFQRVEWARWVNDREASRIEISSGISSSDLSRITRALSSRLGLGRFESEQLLSVQLWLASGAGLDSPVPEALQAFWGSESRGIQRDASLALSTLLGQPEEEAQEHLVALVDELKDQNLSQELSERNLMETARLLFQRGDYAASGRALDEFFLSEAAYGRNRTRGQMLRAQIFLRSDRPEKAIQIVRRMMESARQDGPLALSEASLAAGLFLLERGRTEDASGCYAEAGKACQTLDFKIETTLCFLIRDLLQSQGLTASLEDRLLAIGAPEYQRVLAPFRPAFALVFKRWDLTLEEAVEKAAGSKRASLKPRIEIYSLGNFKAIYNGREIPNSWWRSSKARQLFCYLALDHGRLSEESLVEQFWPGDPAKGKNNLYTTASCIRGALRKAGLEADPLQRSSGTLALSDEIEVWHDCRVLLASTGSSETADSRRALNLYNGAFLPDCYMDWAEETKRRVDEAVLNVSLRLAESAVQQGRLSEAIECGRTALGISPCLDAAHVVVLEALFKQNRFLEVTRHYEACQQTYRLELEHSPPIEVERIFQHARLSL